MGTTLPNTLEGLQALRNSTMASYMAATEVEHDQNGDMVAAPLW